MKYLTIIGIIFLALGCSDDIYENGPNAPLYIDEATILGDCLEIKFSSGGCNGKSWEIQMVDQGVVMESFPVQRNMRLSLKNEELCYALIYKEMSFDLRSIRNQDGKILINLEGWDEPLLYSF